MVNADDFGSGNVNLVAGLFELFLDAESILRVPFINAVERSAFLLQTGVGFAAKPSSFFIFGRGLLIEVKEKKAPKESKTVE